MPVRVAINGFGRVGRSFLRAAHEHNADLEVVAINDLVPPPTLAQLLKYDSVFGRFPGSVAAQDGGISVDGVNVRTLAETDPRELPWDELGVDVVIESTGRFRTRPSAAQHLEAGARKVIISAPAKGDEPPDATVVLGVNFDHAYDPGRHQRSAADGPEARAPPRSPARCACARRRCACVASPSPAPGRCASC
jgi:glyceraldehyde 3-phosphate dehydrogenase